MGSCRSKLDKGKRATTVIELVTQSYFSRMWCNSNTPCLGQGVAGRHGHFRPYNISSVRAARRSNTPEEKFRLLSNVTQCISAVNENVTKLTLPGVKWA